MHFYPGKDHDYQRFRLPWTYFSLRQDTIGILPEPGQNTYADMSSYEAYPPVNALADYHLPGKGTPAGDCGQMRLFCCPDCGEVFEAQRQCDKKTCPNCWRRWAFKLGKRAGLRAWAARKIIMGRRKGRLMHIVISMKYTGGEVNEYKRRAYKIAAKHGIAGGAAVFHHTREDTELHGRVPDGYVHYHIVGLAKYGIVPGEDTDYIFHVIRDAVRGDYRGFQRTGEVIACLTYLLTHSSVKTKTHTLTWFGEMSYNKLNNSTLEAEVPGLMDYLEKKGRTCPICGGTEAYSLWDVEAELEYREKIDRLNRPQPALALEEFGVVIV